jgi:putative ABC transport system permease protein
MRTVDYLRTAESNLSRSRLRTALVILAIVIGTFTLSMTTEFSEGVRQFIHIQARAFAQPATMNVYLKNGDTGRRLRASAVEEYDPSRTAVTARDVTYMTPQDLERIRRTPNVSQAYPRYRVQPDYVWTGSSRKYVIGIDSFYPGTNISLAAGKLPDAEDRKAILLPYQYLAPLGISRAADAVGQKVILHFTQAPQSLSGLSQAALAALPARDVEYTISGVLIDTLQPQNAYLSYREVVDLQQFQFGTADRFNLVFAFTPQLSKSELTALKTSLDDEGYGVFAYSDAIDRFDRIINVVRIALNGLAIIVLLVAMIGIVNIMLIAVAERTQEIGLLKALGLRRSGVFSVFMYEAMVIGLWGGLLGVGLAVCFGLVLNPLLGRTLLKGLEGVKLLSFPPAAMIGIFLLAVLVSLVAGTMPALRASRLDPVDALRRE